MKKKIKERIDAALAQVSSGQTNWTGIVASGSTSKYNVNVIVDDVIQQPTNWKVKDIAARHNVSYWTVYRDLQGKPGWLVFGRTVRVADFLYRQWITNAVEAGLSQ